MSRPTISFDNVEFTAWDVLDEAIIWGSQVYCAEKLGIGIETLATRIKEKHGVSFPEYKHKRQEGIRIKLQQKQYDVAMKGNVSMLIWLGKNMLGQKDRQDIELDGKNISITISEKEKAL